MKTYNIISHYYLLLSSLTTMHLSQSNHLLLSSLTIFSYYHITFYYHLLLSPFTITSYYHLLLSPLTIISYYHLLLSSFTITSYYHNPYDQLTIPSYSICMPSTLYNTISLLHNTFAITNYAWSWNRKHTTYRCCCGGLSEQSFDLTSPRPIQSRRAILLTSNQNTLLHKLSFLVNKDNYKSCVLHHNHHY
jgi:hypothetical protein